MNTGTLIMNALTAGLTARGTVLDSLRARFAQPLAARHRPTRTRAEEAQEVRAMAARLRQSDPGFAADLAAAADRHEGLDEIPGWR